MMAPLYSGDDRYGVSLVPDVRVRYGERFFASVPEGIGYTLVLDGGLKAGPLVKFRFGRDESDGGSTFRVSGKTRDLVGLGDIDPALEWGGFAKYATGDFAGRVELRRGTGGHTGWVMDLSADYRQRVGGVFYALGSRLTLASRDFVQTYYGVNAGQSAASGLPVFGADGGLVSAGVGVRAFMPLGGNWRAGGV